MELVLFSKAKRKTVAVLSISTSCGDDEIECGPVEKDLEVLYAR